jgi:Cu/Ag efflux protein CusF
VRPIAGSVAAALVMALAVAADAQPAAPSRVDWRGTGTVVAMLKPPSDLHATRPVVVLKHDPIAGLMEQSMYMPFIAASATLFDNLHPGDRVTFSLQETPDALLVIAIDRAP